MILYDISFNMSDQSNKKRIPQFQILQRLINNEPVLFLHSLTKKYVANPC